MNIAVNLAYKRTIIKTNVELEIGLNDIITWLKENMIKSDVKHLLIKENMNIYRLNDRLTRKQGEMLTISLCNSAGIEYDTERERKKQERKETPRFEDYKMPEIFNGFTGNLVLGDTVWE